ncbi:MAG: CoA transferase, partial [Actinomycetota bacterium]|nr:CoA transferase [Actinomycetota bacterium]
MTDLARRSPALDRRPRPRRGPLAGIRVADFCWMGVGAVATRLLADFGVEVIKIEDRTRID